MLYKHLLCSLVCLSIPASGLALERNIHGKGSGYHQEGVLVGLKGKAEKRGLFIKSMELDLRLGVGGQ